MKNPIFKAQVDTAFEKVAWPFDLDDVASQASPGAAKDIARGRSLGTSAQKALEEIPDVLRAGRRAVEHFARPASEAVARPFFRMAGGVMDFAKANPALSRYAVGAALLAPILGAAASASQTKQEDQLMHLRQDPGRDVVASLDEFLEKKAAPALKWMSASQMGMLGQKDFSSGLGKGIGSGIGQGIVEGLGSAIMGGVGAVRDMFINDRRRNSLFTTLIQNDVVLADAIERNPHAIEMLKEAYGTLCRFAPSLSLDINAVRSFLREAVIGGSGVNYATIKNLIETEKALHSKGGK